MIIDSKVRSPTPQLDYLDALPSGYNSPALEPQSSQVDLLAQRRMSIAGSPSLAFISVDVSQNNHAASRQLSAPHIDSRDLPSDQGPSVQPPAPKPSKPPLGLKLYPWLTRKESSPPREAPNDMIECSYPTNDCTEILPKNMVIWRKHLTRKHGLVKDSIPQTCQWPGCGMIMGGRSLNRHVLMNHMDFKPSCPHCKVRRRYDHLERHISKCSANPAREVDEN
ncbi:hypothetical protein BDM02DRAFT_811251 [Thelephora ganbajun]|uniref:Uncharacterized protein n=1 Tax=Thelephora ganbajun TaxID=370292 RepID=A0ACB6Z6P5_THEGA|nr:hypothetical protein BDM02DRAFT_811251 [Thelephora ganbajun]